MSKDNESSVDFKIIKVKKTLVPILGAVNKTDYFNLTYFTSTVRINLRHDLTFHPSLPLKSMEFSFLLHQSLPHFRTELCGCVSHSFPQFVGQQS